MAIPVPTAAPSIPDGLKVLGNLTYLLPGNIGLNDLGFQAPVAFATLRGIIPHQHYDSVRLRLKILLNHETVHLCLRRT